MNHIVLSLFARRAPIHHFATKCSAVFCLWKLWVCVCVSVCTFCTRCAISDGITNFPLVLSTISMRRVFVPVASRKMEFTTQFQWDIYTCLLWFDFGWNSHFFKFFFFFTFSSFLNFKTKNSRYRIKSRCVLRCSIEWKSNKIFN